MKKFVLLAHGEIDRSPAGQEAHMRWWSSMEGHVIDSGNPLINGRAVTKQGTVSEIGASTDPALAYTIVQADSVDDAIALLAECPMDMWVYEAMPM